MPYTASVTVLLLTSTLLDAPLARHTVEPSPTNGLRVTSQVQIDRLMSPRRAKVGATIGRLDDEAMTEITRLVVLFLGLV